MKQKATEVSSHSNLDYMSPDNQGSVTLSSPCLEQKNNYLPLIF